MGKKKKRRRRKSWSPWTTGSPRSENAWHHRLKDYEREMTMGTTGPDEIDRLLAAARGAEAPEAEAEAAPSTDVEDEFTKLMEGLDLEAPINVENVSMLSEVELSSRFNKVRQDLLARGEMMDPKTDTGRELHSQRTAYMLEMRRRGMR